MARSEIMKTKLNHLIISSYFK